ncbi:hypothetical protein FRC02_005143 [Tulasnella sp. 418]|nr:hypothetical protein FRC02_005143 [Tulasnella sp. 418]
MEQPITTEDIDREFDALERELAAESQAERTQRMYCLSELEKIDKGENPRAVEDDLALLKENREGEETWTVVEILTKTGVRN